MSEIKEIIIPKERAVFRLDQNGCWRNAHGKFRKKSIIDHFHASIRKDKDGYYLTQFNGDIREKVYFPYEDTVFFVTDVRKGEGEIRLLLNTKEEIPLAPEKLSVQKDNLYIQEKVQGSEERIRFCERALLKLSAHIGFEKGQYYFEDKERKTAIPTVSETVSETESGIPRTD
ncbi:MAG: MFS transporter permease [Desulfococcaceae bacterium]|jgi:hypothetical protein|nr:MFS transporter permease [Desulfococcaceae bacterium]